MKKLIQFRPYIKTVLFSILAAFVIEAVINFDDFKRSFDQGRGIAANISSAENRSITMLPERIARFTGVFYKVVFQK